MIKPRDINSKIWISLLLFGVFILGLVGIAAATGWQETLDAFSRLSLMQFSILLGLSLINYLFRAIRWHIYIDAMDIDLTFLSSARHYIGRRPDSTGSLVLVDRAADLTAVGLVLAIAVATSTAGIQGGWTVAIISLVVAWLATRPALFRKAITLGWKAFGVFPRLFAMLRRAATGLAVFSKPSVLIPTTICGMIGWTAEGVAFYILIIWLGGDIALPTALAIFFFAMLSGSATGLPGGVGGAEAALIALLTLFDIPLEIALPATAIIRITTLWFAIAVGMVMFPFAERLSMNRLNEV